MARRGIEQRFLGLNVEHPAFLGAPALVAAVLFVQFVVNPDFLYIGRRQVEQRRHGAGAEDLPAVDIGSFDLFAHRRDRTVAQNDARQILQDADRIVAFEGLDRRGVVDQCVAAPLEKRNFGFDGYLLDLFDRLFEFDLLDVALSRLEPHLLFVGLAGKMGDANPHVTRLYFSEYECSCPAPRYGSQGVWPGYDLHDSTFYRPNTLGKVGIRPVYRPGEYCVLRLCGRNAPEQQEKCCREDS